MNRRSQTTWALIMLIGRHWPAPHNPPIGSVWPIAAIAAVANWPAPTWPICD